MRRLVALTVFLLGTGLATSAEAAPVLGFLGWTGTGVLTFSTGGGAPGTNFIDWCPTNIAGSGCVPDPGGATGLGDITVGSTSGSFLAESLAGTFGDIKDQTDAPGNPVPYTTIVPGPVFVTDWIELDDVNGGLGEPDWTFTLTQLDLQSCPTTAVTFCTGTFFLTQVGSNVSVNMSGLGFISDGLGNLTGFTMLITGNFSGTTIAALVAAAASGAGAFTFSWSGELNANTVIPEPATLLLFGSGTAMLAFRRRRRTRA